MKEKEIKCTCNSTNVESHVAPMNGLELTGSYGMQKYTYECLDCKRLGTAWI